MAFQFQNFQSPLISGNQGLADLLGSQIELLQGQNAPAFGDTAGAFDTARAAATTRQGDVTSNLAADAAAPYRDRPKPRRGSPVCL